MTEKSLSNTIFDTAYPEILNNIKKAEAESPCGNKARLLAATKTVPVEVINEAISKGLDLIGENKVQELKEKYPNLDKSAEIHFIGNLQTNKVKDVIPMVSMIHSVSSEKLAAEISKQCQKFDKDMDVLLQINIGNEDSKSGFSADEIFTACENISKLPRVFIKGLMAIPPICENEQENSKYFCKMRQLFIDIEAKKMDNVSMVYLSMGMSGDYMEAIRCGANIVRIGSSLFGERNYNK
jgi:pyridoxal phosphate enzyme (YggS family)